MDLTPELVAEIWTELQRRVEAIKAVGGISVLEVMEGRKVPKGWKLDVVADYFVPPDFVAVTTLQ
jgi:hypothetical protein